MTHSSASARPSRPVAAVHDGGGAAAVDGPRLLARAAADVLARPLLSLAWVAGLAAAVVVGPVWGAAFAFMGWLAARERMADEGLAGLGAVLAPPQAARQYDRGLFGGVWRAQKLGLAIGAVTAPTTVLALAPAAIASALLAPSAAMLPGDAALVVGTAAPAALALTGAVLVAAHGILLHRLLAAVGPDYTVGLVARASAAAWRTTLRDGKALAALAAGAVAIAVAGGAFVYANMKLAGWLELGAGSLVVATWTGGLAAALAITIVLEALAAWAEDTDTEPFATTRGFSLSDAIVGWLAHVTGGGAKGLVAVGVFAAALAGLASSFGAVAAGWSASSLPALGWFAATLAALVVLHLHGRKS